MLSGPVFGVLVVCILFLMFGFMFKGQCLQGGFNERAFRDLCYNDIQPLFGPRLHRIAPDGSLEPVFPYIHATADGSLQAGEIEYPVLTGLFMYATGLLVDDGDSYLRVSALLLAPFGLFAAFALARMSGWRALLFAAAPAVVLYAFHNWDLLVVAAAVAGLWAWSRGSPVWAGVAFGVGAGFKMWPIFFLAPLFFDLVARRDLRKAILAPAAGVVTLLAINLPFALANFEGWWATYRFHRDRGPNFDSIWYFGRPEWTAHDVNLWSALLTGAFFIAILAVAWVRARPALIRSGAPENPYPFLQVCAALLATFLLWNKVHSPQFTLWLLAFFVLLRVNIAWWVAYTLADLAVYVGVFRWFYDFGQGQDFTDAKRLLIAGVWVRAGLLVALVVVFLFARDALLRPSPGRAVEAASPGDAERTTGEPPPLDGSELPSTGEHARD